MMTMIDLDACEGDSFSVVYDIDWFYTRFITINYDRENFLFKSLQLKNIKNYFHNTWKIL